MKAESKAIIFGRYNEQFHPVVPLHLKPLSSISNEDAIEIAKILGFKESQITPLFVLKVKGKTAVENLDYKYANGNIISYIQIYQFLQLKDYATPQTVIEDGKVVTYSVEELVELGIYKLI